MNTETEAKIAAVQSEWARLLGALKGEIGDEYRATDDSEDETPGMCVTFGITVEEDGFVSWGYQTGDNSYTGGAYCHPVWAVVSLYRDSDCAELAKSAMEEAMEQVG